MILAVVIGLLLSIGFIVAWPDGAAVFEVTPLSSLTPEQRERMGIPHD